MEFFFGGAGLFGWALSVGAVLERGGDGIFLGLLAKRGCTLGGVFLRCMGWDGRYPLVLFFPWETAISCQEAQGKQISRGHEVHRRWIDVRQ